MQEKTSINICVIVKKYKKDGFYGVKQCKYVVLRRLKNEKKSWTSARFAAAANSVRELEMYFDEVGEAGLSLRDITYMQTDASRQKEIASINVVSGKYITNFVCWAHTA